jgi:hypothetical protein
LTSEAHDNGFFLVENHNRCDWVRHKDVDRQVEPIRIIREIRSPQKDVAWFGEELLNATLSQSGYSAESV